MRLPWYVGARIILALSLALWLVIFGAVYAFAQAPEPSRKFDFKLDTQQLGVIEQGLNELPRKFSEAVLRDLIRQMQEQIKADKPVEGAKPKE